MQTDVTMYHASPHGLRDGLRDAASCPSAFVNTASVHERKRAALACHRSQRGWLDATQGMDSYRRHDGRIRARVGAMSRNFKFAEGGAGMRTMASAMQRPTR